MRNKTYFNLLFIIFAVLSTYQTSRAQDTTSKTQQPNIVVFMVDQMISRFIEPYGNCVAKTPNMKKLAADGVTFANTYTTCPVCVPARYSLLTGMYLKSHGAYDNGSMLRSDIPTHNDYLNKAGYETAISGKAHFIGPDQLHGFTKRFLTDVYPSEMKFMPQRNAKSNYKDLHPKPIAIDYVGENAGPVQESMLLDYDERAVFNGIRYLSEKKSNPAFSAQENPPPRSKTPFFLQISINAPHEPFFAYKKYWDLYEGVDIPIPNYAKDIEENYTSMDRSLNTLHGVERVDLRDSNSLKRIYRSYFACLSYADDKLGEVMEALDQFGLKDNTIIIFVSDHGDMLGHRGMVQKRVFYDYSSKIPLIISAPDKYNLMKKGIKVEEPVSITDIAPTLAELGGIKDYIPMDGKSLLPLMKDEKQKDRYIFCENYSEGVNTICLMVRQGNCKYTYIHKGDKGLPETQLYDVEKDPEEKVNLIGKQNYAPIEAKLKKLMFENFNPEQLDKDAQLSFERRKVIHEARKKSNAPKWDYRPYEDVSNMYWR
jgi:choline-sulfatase